MRQYTIIVMEPDVLAGTGYQTRTTSHVYTSSREAWIAASKLLDPKHRVFVCELPEGPGGTACFEATEQLTECLTR